MPGAQAVPVEQFGDGAHLLTAAGRDPREQRVDRVHVLPRIFAGGDLAGEDRTITIPYNPSFFDEGDPEDVYTLAGTGEEITGIHVVARFEVRQPQKGGA